MHIKRMHDMIEKLTKCTEMEFEKGAENVDTKEMGEVIDMIKDLSEAEYYATITKAMEESEYGEDYDYMGAYDDNSRRGYRGQPRDSRGRYMSRRGRRGYEQPMGYRVPDIYADDMEMYRDMDRMDGRMYYTGGSSGSSQGGQSSGGSSQSGGMSSGMSSGQGGSNRNYGGESGSNSKFENRMVNARKGYEEVKTMQDNSPDGKKKTLESLENYLKELSEDMTSLVNKMDANEKAMLKSKLTTLTQKL